MSTRDENHLIQAYVEYITRRPILSTHMQGSGAKPKLKGYSYQLSDPRILERLETEDTFTDVFSYGEAGDRQLALICFEEEIINALATMVRGQAVASYKRVVRFAALTEIEPPIAVDELLAAMPATVGRRVGVTLREGGAIDPARFSHVVSALLSVRPKLDSTVNDLAMMLGAVRRRGAGRDEVLGFERDALGVALDAAGLDRVRPQVLRAWRPSAARAPFLQGVRDRRFDEDQMVAFDLRVFGDWKLQDVGDPVVVSFTDGRRQVTVANVNRTNVETSTGADLIYFSHDWTAYVLVQYKRMEHESGTGWSFRPSRAGRLPEELERLKALPRASGEVTESGSFRLSDEAAYLKLCRRLHLGAGEGRLADGIYLPVSLYELLVDAPEARGPRGGRRLALAAMRERWLTNASFVEMVGRGFIGTRDADTDAITAQIRVALESNRSVTLAAGGETRYRAV